MGLRGESVGRAYVQILADGTGLPESIRKELHDAEPGVSEAGAEHSEAYQKAFADRMKRNHELSNAIDNDIQMSFGEMKADSNFLAEIQRQVSDGVANGLKDGAHDKQARELGDRIGRNVRKQFADTGVLDFSVSGEIDKVLRDIEREAAEFEKSVKTHIEPTRNRMQRFSDTIDRATDKFGRAFGKDSRNNAVHFFGSIVAGAINAVDIIPKMILKLTEMGAKARTTFTEAGGGATGFFKAIGPLVGSVAALAVGIAVMVAVAGPVVSLLFGIAGAVLALASALAFASTAVLGVMGALIFPLIGGIAALGLAFTGLSDKMKKSLKEAFHPILHEFHELQDIAQKGVLTGVTRAGKDFAEAFKGLRPLMRGISHAVGDVIEGFGRAVNSPGMKAFLETMSEALPGMIKSLGRIFTNTIGGFGGLFAAAIPIAQRFLGWLEKVTKNFSTYTNSTKGKNELVGFFDKAAESAEKVWGLIKQVGGVLKRLLFNEDGREAGGTILDDMSDGLQRISDWLDAHPDALEKFFKNGIETMRSLGGFLRAVTHALDTLDTPQNRQLANKIFGAIGVAITIVSGIIKASGFPALIEFLTNTWRKGKRLLEFLTGFREKIETALGKVNLVEMITSKGLGAKILGPFGGHLPNIRKTLGKIHLKDMVSGSGLSLAVVVPFAPLGARALHVLGKIKIKDAVDVFGVVAKVLFPFSGLAAKILSAIGHIDIGSLIPDSITIAGHKVNIGTAAGGMFFGSQLRQIGEAGPEAVVPLNRPLNQVDPAVRALSAFAQGIPFGGSSTNNSRTIEVGGLTIITPTSDPVAVARETINRMAAASYA